MPQPITSTIDDNHKLLGLDHLRALAIVSVFFYHYKFFGHPAWEPAATNFGWTGVDLFFVLSGFLIAGQLFNGVAKGKPIPMREFFLKRFFRIIPPFFLIITLYALFPYLKEWGNLSPLWRYYSFTPRSQKIRYVYPCLVAMCGGTILPGIAAMLLAVWLF